MIVTQGLSGLPAPKAMERMPPSGGTRFLERFACERSQRQEKDLPLTSWCACGQRERQENKGVFAMGDFLEEKGSRP